MPPWYYFQYPLRAYGLSNCRCRRTVQLRTQLSVPSTGLWAEQHRGRRGGGTDGDTLSVPSTGLWAEQPNGRCAMLPVVDFQYPLRAYGLSNRYRGRSARTSKPLSVPSTGLWAEQRGAPSRWYHVTVLSVPSTGLWAEQLAPQTPPRPTLGTFSTLYGPMG